MKRLKGSSKGKKIQTKARVHIGSYESVVVITQNSQGHQFPKRVKTDMGVSLVICQFLECKKGFNSVSKIVGL